MTWGRLQGASNGVASGNGTVTYGSNVASGTKLICAVTVDFSTGGNPVSSVKDAAGNTMTLLKSLTDTGNTVFTGLYAMDTPAGDVGTQPVLTATVSANFGVAMHAQEVSGLATGNTLAAMCDGSGSTAQGTASPATAGAYSTTAANEYLLAVVGDPGFTRTYTETGYTADAANLAANGNAEQVLGYKNSTGGAETLSWAISGAANWITLLIAFQLAAAGTDTSPAYAAAQNTTAAAGTGTWVNPANAENAADSAYATWTAP